MSDLLSVGTDCGHVREMARIPVVGIAPSLNSPWMAHQNNELINEREFLREVDRYVTIIRDIASTSKADVRLGCESAGWPVAHY